MNSEQLEYNHIPKNKYNKPIPPDIWAYEKVIFIYKENYVPASLSIKPINNY